MEARLVAEHDSARADERDLAFRKRLLEWCPWDGDVFDPSVGSVVAVQLSGSGNVINWHNSSSHSVGREHHSPRAIFASDQIDETAAHRPFQAAIAPMDPAVRALKLTANIMVSSEGLDEPAMIRGHRRNAAHSTGPLLKAWGIVNADLHRACRRHVADSGHIRDAQSTAKELPIAEFLFESLKQGCELRARRSSHRGRFRLVLARVTQPIALAHPI